ncbi:MAG: rhamnulokinase [Planctomycetota bacterium]
MADVHHFLALDLGAESGRGELVTLRDGDLEMEEVHRFANLPVRMGGTLYWNLPSLFGNVVEAIRRANDRGVTLSGISVDTWGVDFGLLGADGKLLGLPVAYRDRRTEGIHEKTERIMPIREIFMATALHTMPINTLFQLHAMQLEDSPLLEVADTFLMMPDLLSYYLTGRKVSEVTIAQTSQLVGKDCNWSPEITRNFSLPERMFPELVGPAEVIGPLLPEIAEQAGITYEVPVIASAAHDTGAAVGAVPGEGENWAFLSSGTWSIMGMLVDQPIATEAAYDCGFTNEVTYGGWYFARNILGLWLVQELRRKWDTADDAWDYDRMTAEAAEAPSGLLVDVDDQRLLAPADMEAALKDLLRESGQMMPASRGELVRCVLESLALLYGWGLDQMGEMTGNSPSALYIVGGGIRNQLLCQFTANAAGIPVHAGVDQGTAVGNALGQALALGVIDSPQTIRDIVRDSFEVRTYQPQDPDEWTEKRQRFSKLQGSHAWG